MNVETIKATPLSILQQKNGSAETQNCRMSEGTFENRLYALRVGVPL